MRLKFGFIILIAFISLKVKSQNHPKSYICYKAKESLIIDGELNEESWSIANWTDEFVDIEGDKKLKPFYNTRVKMLWDSRYLYIAAELEDEHIWANLTKRDTIIYFDNDFEVFIDPNGDNHEYYEFEINAFGTEWNLFLQRPYRDWVKPLNGWDIKGVKSAIKIYGTLNDPGNKDQKWTVEIAMPWDALKEFAYPKRGPIQGEQWRINFSRVQWLTEVVDNKYVKKGNPKTNKLLPEQNWVWSPQGAINIHMPEMWGYVQFSEKKIGDNKDEFQYDLDWNLKMQLMHIYYAQKEYFKNNRRFAKSYDELGIERQGNIMMEVTSKQFILYAVATNGQSIYVNHESKIWYE